MKLPGLPKRLRACRAAADLTQEAVANVLGVTPDTISNYERGRTEPSLADIVRIARLYGVSVEHLVAGSTPTPPRCLHGIPAHERCGACEATVPKFEVA